MDDQFDITLYNDEFFEWHHRYTRDYQIKTFNWFMDRFTIFSVADFGCGIGTYLEAAYDKGIKQLKGFDIGGEFARKYTPDHLQCYIEYIDCTKPINLTEKFTTVLSFETAEHIKPAGTDQFVMNMVHAVMSGGYILFTGAPPGQQGTGHINLQEKQFWIDKFEYHGMVEGKKRIHFMPDITQYVASNWKEITGTPTYITDSLLIFQKQ